MGKFFIRIVFLIVFQWQSISGYAQVNVQDSLALVALYNATDGTNWTNNTNWLSTPVSQWYGVQLQANRVWMLSLNNNNLIGTLPNQVCDFTALKYWYFDGNKISGTVPSCIGNAVSMVSFSFRNNNLTGAISNDFLLMPFLTDVWISNNDFDVFPDLRSLPDISNMALEGNRFTFEDIEPNVAILNTGFSYSPQDSVGTTENIVVNIFTSFTFTVAVGGANNTYQWYKDGQALVNNARFSGVTTPTMTASNAQLADAGDYTCSVKNTVAIFLTLQSRDKKVAIFDTRLDQTIKIFNNDTIYCNQNKIRVFSNSSAGITNSSELISGNAFASIVNDTITTLGMGSIDLRVYNDGNLSYKPASATLQIKIVSSLTIPAIAITSNAPVKVSDSLTLSVPSVAGLQYKWITPKQVFNNTVSFVISNVQLSDSGIYSVQVKDNVCIVGNDSLTVNVKKYETVLVVYELITPNGDGKNDLFYIENLENSPNTEVSIYNAWNQIVFHSTHYENNWDGGGLPIGSYFYSVREFDCRCETHKGMLYIKR